MGMHDELEKRLRQLKQHLSTPGLDAEKITSSLHTLSGLDLGLISHERRVILEDYLSEVNEILRQYRFKEWSDYQQLSRKHRKFLIKHLSEMHKMLIK